MSPLHLVHSHSVRLFRSSLPRMPFVNKYPGSVTLRSYAGQRPFKANYVLQRIPITRGEGSALGPAISRRTQR